MSIALNSMDILVLYKYWRNKMKIKYILILMIIFMNFILSCDEINKIINPPTDEYMVDKTINASSNEQIVESGSDIKIIFPANSLKSNIELKIKKESTFPAFSISNTKLGNNIYKIKLKGNTDFSSPIKIIINYDKSKIPSGKSVAESVKGYIYSNGNWKIGEFQIDEFNFKIVFTISNIDIPKSSKENPSFQDKESEVIFGDGYTNTDTGQSDNPLASNNYFGFHLTSTITFNDGDTDNDVQWDFEYYTDGPKIIWNGNNFSFKKEKIEPKDWIKDYETKPDSTIEIGTGTVTSDGKKIIKFNYEYYRVRRTYYDAERKPDLDLIQKTFVLENLELFLPDLIQFPNAFPFQEITGPDIGQNITKLTCYYYFYAWDPFYKHDDITERKSVSSNWNGTYSRLGVYFRKF
jgi:hypothetical protein